MLQVHPSVPAKSLAEFIALAKAKPGALTYASAGPGSITQLLGEWIKLKGHVNIFEVPYKSVGAEMPDLLGGQIHTAYLVATVVAAHIQSGKLRPLALAAKQRLPLFPDVPTAAEQGVANYEASSWFGVVAPIHTPKETLAQLEGWFAAALKDSEVKPSIAR